MIISASTDYRAAAQRKLPPFLFHYIDGGAYAEYTMRRNVEDLAGIALRQRVLKNMSELSLETELFGEKLAMPVALAPVGLTGMYARRGEVQAAKAAAAKGIPFTLSTVSVCPIEEVAPAIDRPMWFQLYVLKDRGFMRNALERAKAAGVTTLVFTVDMPTPGARYRDAHSGMSGPNAPLRRMLQAVTHPAWAWDVGLLGKPHDLGNISTYRGNPTGLADYIGWLGANFDPSISWKDLEWIREFWDGPMVIKGILDPEDAKDAVKFGADGIVVSNHGGRQLDGVLSSARGCPRPTGDSRRGEGRAEDSRRLRHPHRPRRGAHARPRRRRRDARPRLRLRPGRRRRCRRGQPARPVREGDARGHGPHRRQIDRRHQPRLAGA